MSAMLQIRKTEDGRILARRLDGRPLTAADCEEAKKLAEATPLTDATAGEIVAVLIDSEILQAPLWFALRDDWRPDAGDATPVFYASELPFLRTKSAESLREIFKTKAAFGGGMVRQ